MYQKCSWQNVHIMIKYEQEQIREVIDLSTGIVGKISQLTDEQAEIIISTFSSQEHYQGVSRSCLSVQEKDCRTVQELSSASERD